MKSSTPNTKMTILIALVFIPYILWAHSPLPPPQAPQALNYIFQSGEGGYACFRIPALVASPNGTLLAFAEGRRNGCSDTGNIDLLLKRSFDGGKTWGDIQVVWDDGDNTCGNPAPVVDRHNGRIFLLATWNLGTDHEREIIQGTSTDTRRVYVTSSADDGRTWSPMTEITKRTKKKNWTWYATGPGTGIQLEYSRYAGRLVVPANHVVAGSHQGFSHVIYSDNRGRTWKLGGISSRPQTNESTIAELPSGELMLNMRNYDPNVRFRQVVLSDDGGVSWPHGYQDNALIEPVCHASLVRHQFPGRTHLSLAFSNPAHQSKRLNMTVKVSDDNGKTWRHSVVVHTGPSAYSSLASLPDGDIAILYEGGLENPYEGIAFQRLSFNAFSESTHTPDY